MVRPLAVISPMSEAARATSKPPAGPGEVAPPAAEPASRPDISVVVRSKIQAPVLRSSTLSRKRLLDRLSDATQSRLTLVIAEAGYGKTTLLADFAAHSGLRTLWYRLDSSDADAITWTNYLIAAAREVMPDFGQATESLLGQISTGSPPDQVIVASFINALSDLGETPTTLVLDDFHAVDESAAAREFVEHLLGDAPSWLRLIVASRRRPTLRLGRLDAMGEVAQVGTDDLRFSLEETGALFAEGYGEPLEDEVLREVDTRTRGWAASLQLFHGSIRGKSSTAIRSLARSLSGELSPIYDFLAEEVLGNVPEAIDRLLVRASLLRPVVAGQVVALFGDTEPTPTLDDAAGWIDEADRLGLLSRVSHTSDSRLLHPLLRDFLERRLRQHYARPEIAAMHRRVANAVKASDPLTATHHYLEAGDEAEAMHCLGASLMVTMGSGQWGVASELIDRFHGVTTDPAVAAIRARRLIEEGELSRVATLLSAVDEADSAPEVRAVFRHAKLSLGWRTGDRDLMFATLEQIRDDLETPPILRDIAQVFIDASPLSAGPVPYPALAKRMERMSVSQEAAGHFYFAAISLHNAAIAAAAAGLHNDAIDLCTKALDAYERLAMPASERYSTHALLASCWFERGNAAVAEEHVALGLASGDERGDVPAEFALLYALVGDLSRAHALLNSADLLHEHGLSDLQGTTTATIARAFLSAARDPDHALALLAEVPKERPLDVGDTLGLTALECLCKLNDGRLDDAAQDAQAALTKAKVYGARTAEVRLRLILALARQDPRAINEAITDSLTVGHLALLQVADAVIGVLNVLSPAPPALVESMKQWPLRWLPLLRKALESGPGPLGRAAAILLEEVGQFEDVARLRAYEKTYGRRTRGKATAGRALAKRVGPKLEIRDLGRVTLGIADRELQLSRSRRKPASLLMFLVTRPNLTAHRDEVLDALWPEADPTSATNSLNQSLYFVRRDIDPWYEDDMSLDYVRFEGELLWLDGDLTQVASADFLSRARSLQSTGRNGVVAKPLVLSYAGKFAPEFEYEEWAMGWRTRLHAVFLDAANAVVDASVAAGDLRAALTVANHVMAVDPSAAEVERKLVLVYWRMGARSSALAHYDRLALQDRADGLEPPTLEELVGNSRPQ